MDRILLMAPDAREQHIVIRALAIEGYWVCAAQDSGGGGAKFTSLRMLLVSGKPRRGAETGQGPS